jgi:Bacterial regulatory helix-turn-helix protein, lysR family
MRRRITSNARNEREFSFGLPTSMLGSRIPLALLIQTLAVAEYLNFRHAANALGVSLSSVSARVKTLEDFASTRVRRLLDRWVEPGDDSQWSLSEIEKPLPRLGPGFRCRGVPPLPSAGWCGSA